MKTVSISENKFRNLKNYSYDDLNTEGELYRFSYHGMQKLFKKLYVEIKKNLIKKFKRI